MKIKFLVDFRGRETLERFYQKGQVVDSPQEIAERMIADKRAAEVVGKPPVVVADEKPAVIPAQQKRRGGK